MTKGEFYAIVGIDSPEEFEYFENMTDMLEAPDQVETELIEELVSGVDTEFFAEMADAFFKDLSKRIPSDLSAIHLNTNIFRDRIISPFSGDMTSSDIEDAANAISSFRKWYTESELVKDRAGDRRLSVMDAVFDLSAAGFTGETYDYDFGDAHDIDLDYYEVRMSDLVGSPREADDADESDSYDDIDN